MPDNVTLDGPIFVEHGWRLFMAVCAISVSVTAVTFNGLLILVIIQTRSLRTPTNTFIVSLAAGEVLVGLFYIPFAASSFLANGWPFSRTTCRASAMVQIIGRTVATLSLLSMCVDRCVAVSRPLMYSAIITFKFAAIMLSCAWALALIMSVLPLGLWGGFYSYSGAFFACILQRTQGHHQYLVKESICTFGPAFVILTCLIVIIKEVKCHHRVFALFPVPSAQMIVSDNLVLPNFMPQARSFNRNTMKALRPLFVTCFLYGLFCLPAASLYVAVQRWTFISELHPFNYIVVWLSFFSSVLNPVVVILFRKKFRDRVKSICRLHRMVWSPQVHKEPFTISTGLQTILSETTWIGNTAKPGMKTSTRGHHPIWNAANR